MSSPNIMVFLCAGTLVASALWAEPPARFGQLEAANDALKLGRAVSPKTWEGIRGEAIEAMAHPDVMARIDLPGIARASAPIMARDAMLDLSRDANAAAHIEAQRYLSLLLARGAELQSSSGANYQSDPNKIILKPLLILANNWIVASESLKEKGADASAPAYSGGVGIAEGTTLTDEIKEMIAKDAKYRALVPLSARLSVIIHDLDELSRVVKSTVERLKAAGETKFIEDAIMASGITQERFRRLIAL